MARKPPVKGIVKKRRLVHKIMEIKSDYDKIAVEDMPEEVVIELRKLTTELEEIRRIIG